MEVKGITSKPSSIPADKAPGDDLRENSCNGTSIPCPIAYIQRNSDSSHGRSVIAVGPKDLNRIPGASVYQ